LFQPPRWRREVACRSPSAFCAFRKLAPLAVLATLECGVRRRATQPLGDVADEGADEKEANEAPEQEEIEEA